MKRTIVFLMLMLACGQLAALDFIVNSTADVPDAAPGNQSCNPVNAIGNTCTLRAAIMEANALGGSHSILLPSGTYSLTQLGQDDNAASTGDLDITADIVITNGTSTPPRITANYNHRVFDVREGGSLSLINIQVTGGEATVSGFGGGINVGIGATLLLEDVVINENIANVGGGIYNKGTASIQDSYFYNNVTTEENSFILDPGGNAILNRGIMTISGSTFRGNGLIPGGAGLFLDDEYAIEARTVQEESNVTLISNSTFWGNTRGVFSDEVPLGISQSTFVDNGDRGLRFLADVTNLNSQQLQISSSVFYGHDIDCNGPYFNQTVYDVSDRVNASSDSTCSFDGASDFENIAYPFLDNQPTDHGGPTRVLMPNPLSELVDPVEDLCMTNQDQRGRPRPIDSGSGLANCDIGAVEYDPAIDPPEPALFADGFENA